MNDILEPLVLATGSHSAGSGYGCAMNVISWENGDKIISDMPECSDPMLAYMVQNLNDSIGTQRGSAIIPPEDSSHRHVYYVIPAEWSMRILDVAHLTVGTMLPIAHATYVWRQLLKENGDQGADFKGSIRESLESGDGFLLVCALPTNFTIFSDEFRLGVVKRLIMRFREIAGITESPALPVPLEEAVCKMREKVDA